MATVGLDQMDRVRKPLARDGGKARGLVLIGGVLDPLADDIPPARDPGATEGALAIVEEKWLPRGCPGWLLGPLHGASLLTPGPQCALRRGASRPGRLSGARFPDAGQVDDDLDRLLHVLGRDPLEP